MSSCSVTRRKRLSTMWRTRHPPQPLKPLHQYVYACWFVRLHICIYVYKNIYVCTHFSRISISTYLCIHICVCIYMHTLHFIYICYLYIYRNIDVPYKKNIHAVCTSAFMQCDLPTSAPVSPHWQPSNPSRILGLFAQVLTSATRLHGFLGFSSTCKLQGHGA